MTTATKTAKIFKNGASQAVRLPAEYRFPETQVFIRRDDLTGDVVLSGRPGGGVWREFFENCPAGEPSEFMANRPMNVPPGERNLFTDGD